MHSRSCLQRLLPYALTMTAATPFVHGPFQIAVEPLSDAAGPIRIIWLHGWGMTRDSLRPLSHSLLPLGESWLVDLPGHGHNPAPAEPASPAAMADTLLAWLATLAPMPTILIGHSMGFRIAIHATSRHVPSLIGIVAIAGAGVPKNLTFQQVCWRMYVRGLMRVGRLTVPFLGAFLLDALRQRFGSADYLACPAAMKSSFLANVQDDVTSLLPSIVLPTLLIYGELDDATPPDVGHRFAQGLTQASLHVIPHHTHHSLLGQGRHVVASLIRPFIETLRHQVVANR